MILQPFATRTTPPVATTRIGSSANGLVTDSSASGSRIESASTMHTSGYPATLIPTFSASALPPLSLRTTTSPVAPERGRCTERTRPRYGTSPGITRGTSTRSNAERSSANVSSVDPSSTTTTSYVGYRSDATACTAVTIPAPLLYAGISTLTGSVSGLR